MNDQKRLVLIEILIVAAIIGLVSTLSAVAVSSARSNARDAVRLSSVRQIQASLENFFVVRNSYPVTDGVITLGSGSAACLTTDGFRSACDSSTEGILTKLVPATFESGLNGLSACGGSANAFCYLVTDGGDSYIIQFELEHAVPLAKLQKGLNCAGPEGMVAGACKGF
jgi:type II secretory pathway pseudopilin PulG